MERDRSELEELLPESSTQLVSLNTRIPRFVSRMIDESVGILQTESQYLKVSKQVAIQILIERGFEALREEFERQDNAISEVVASMETTGEELVSLEQAPKKQPTYDMKAYAEMANKIVYEPRKPPVNSGQSESANFLRKKLGLR